MRVCLDTSGYSHFRQGMPEALQTATRARSVLVPAIVLGELRVGFRLGTRRSENEERLRQFIEESAVAILAADDEAASHYADIVVELRRRGTPYSHERHLDCGPCGPCGPCGARGRHRAHLRRALCPHRSRRIGDSVTNAVVVVAAG